MATFSIIDDEPEIPVSRFYRLQPINLGTPLVESFTGYFEREAAEMSLLPGILATREVVPWLAPSSTYSNGKTNQLTATWANNCSPALNGLTDSTRDWVRTLESLTLRNDLQYLTMLPWHSVISWRGLIKRTRAWCGMCYNAAARAGRTVYSPLLWYLEPIIVCTEHGVRLTSSCPTCGNSLPIMDSSSRPGWCSKCRHWLGGEHTEQTSVNFDEWQSQVRTTTWLGEMLAITPTLKDFPQRDVIKQLVSETIDMTYSRNAKALARAVGMNHKSIYELRNGTQIPQLKTLLKLCTILDMSPTELLIERAERKPISPATIVFPKSSISPHNFHPDYVKSVLKAAAEDSTWPPTPLIQIVDRLGADRSHLQHRFPDLCAVIVKRYHSYQTEKRALRIRILCDRIQSEARKLHNSGIYPSMWQLGKIMSVFIMREKEAYDAWQQVLRELGYISTSSISS